MGVSSGPEPSGQAGRSARLGGSGLGAPLLSAPSASSPCEPSTWHLLEMGSWPGPQPPRAPCAHAPEVWPRAASPPCLAPALGGGGGQAQEQSPGVPEALLGLRAWSRLIIATASGSAFAPTFSLGPEGGQGRGLGPPPRLSHPQTLSSLAITWLDLPGQSLPFPPPQPVSPWVSAGRSTSQTSSSPARPPARPWQRCPE